MTAGGQLSPSVWPHNPATGFRPPSATVVSAELFSRRTGTLRCLQKEMATYRHWSVSLWWDPDDVPHCQILSPDKTEWRLISATLCRWRHCFVADQLWFMTRIWEEEERSDIVFFCCFIKIMQLMSGGRIVLIKLSLCYSIVYYYNGAQWYEQFLQALVLLGLALCLPSASVSLVFMALYRY